MTVYSRASEPRARTSSKLSRLVSRPLDAGDPCAQHRNQLKPARRRAPDRQERADAVGLIALDVHQEHVRARRARDCIENSSSRLACSDRTPTMKKAPRPTASRMTRVWLPGRDRCAARRGAAETTASSRAARPPDQQPCPPAAARAPARRSRRRHTSPTSQRRRLPGRQRHERGRHQDHRGPAASSRGRLRRRFVAQQQRRLDEPHLQQRHDREQQRHEHADADALRGGAPRHAVLDVGQQRRRCRAERRSGIAATARAAPARRRAGCPPGRASAPAGGRRR